MSNKPFAKTKLAASLSLVLGVPMGLPAFAEEAAVTEDIEVVQVKGVRSSIKESTRLKRDAVGVVDAISAEDIGKFPDTNLAEALQRITGVSIDRSNGEGSKVTVRGFGPDYNMVTVNGRTMPASSLPAGGGTPNSRSFDFSNLSGDSVRTVEVYKTSKANIASGGIGSTIDITTARPLDIAGPGFQGSVAAKALYDTTNRVGDDVTPELSGIASWVNNDASLGATVSLNYQKRDSSAAGAYVNQWRTSPFDGTIPQAADDINLTNPPAMGQLYSMPSDLRYTIADRERERTNALVSLQFAPTNDLVATLEYMHSQQDLFEARAEQSIWMDTYKSDLTFDDNAVKTPIHYREERREQLPRDIGLALQELNQTNKNDSFGLNITYQLTDSFSMMFDAHNSKAVSEPDAPYGSWLNAGLGANIVNAQEVDFTRDLPGMFIDFDDCRRTNLNCNGILDQDDVGTSILDANFARQESEITQFRLEGSYELDSGSIDFGIESRSMESHSLQSLTRNTMGNWGIENPGELPDGFLTPTNFLNEFDDFDTTGSFDQAFTGSASQVGEWAAGAYGFDFAADGAFATNRTIKEDIYSGFAQFNWSNELFDRPYNLVVGLRYEKTDITSTANIDLPNAVAWEGNNDFNVRYGTQKEDFSLSADYDHWLPNIDFDIEIIDNVITRASYSTTIGRPTYDQLSSAATVSGPGAPTLIPGAAPATASTGNPALIPLESDNFDVSAEWYFDDTSYVSAGYYLKKVSNFIGIAPQTQNFYDLRDATAGPRAQAALAELQARGLPITDSNLFQMTAAMENNVDFDSMSYEEFEAMYDILPDSSDPLMDFLAQVPTNNKKATIDGFEFAVQHFFGETGFGFQANYTTVDGDVDFDVNADPGTTQFALVGLSDTANVILMYEIESFSARIAYNWRDKFLNSPARYNNEPSFTEAYQQFDFNVAYNFNESLSIFLEGINVTEENSRQHGRYAAQLWQVEELGARYHLGARYSF
ncbi:TonB-dependent receptor [Paraferrimonas haliotis]|uniref:TonB-dependent receptor n=1 Tax=Paraferrimonas haliotis TaxID=2013866 RepID=A0AA37TN75_9GAMM|nr:TonB-dependent receptor [Paraferrimonas haliotis]GLS83518.1 TonB-dependent receptor [Paraferrimonas haliotis]